MCLHPQVSLLSGPHLCVLVQHSVCVFARPRVHMCMGVYFSVCEGGRARAPIKTTVSPAVPPRFERVRVCAEVKVNTSTVCRRTSDPVPPRVYVCVCLCQRRHQPPCCLCSLSLLFDQSTNLASVGVRVRAPV